MSVFGKVLAVLNILAAAAFVYLATQARATRTHWSYAAFRHELVLDGLPLDERDTDEDGTPIAQRITDSTASDMFRGGPGSRTLRQEFDRRKNELRGEVDQAADDAAKRHKAEQVLLLTARTGGERDALRELIRAGKLDEAFEQAFAVPTGGNRDAQRQAMVHILVAAAEVPGDREKTEQNLRRVYTAAGVRDYVRAVEGHALNARAMGERVRQGAADDRGDFIARHDLRVSQIVDLSQHVEDLRRHLQQLTDQRTENHAPLVAERRKDVEALQTELAAAEAARDKALAQQTALEKSLFAVQRKLGQANEKNQQLERDIRGLELGR